MNQQSRWSLGEMETVKKVIQENPDLKTTASLVDKLIPLLPEKKKEVMLSIFWNRKSKLMIYLAEQGVKVPKRKLNQKVINQSTVVNPSSFNMVSFAPKKKNGTVIIEHGEIKIGELIITGRNITIQM